MVGAFVRMPWHYFTSFDHLDVLRCFACHANIPMMITALIARIIWSHLTTICIEVSEPLKLHVSQCTSKTALTVSLHMRLAAHSLGFPFKFGLAKLHAPNSLEHNRFVKGAPPPTLPVVRVQPYLSSPLSV
jgi:hypothetical protein